MDIIAALICKALEITAALVAVVVADPAVIIMPGLILWATCCLGKDD
jgi:hypothetical protein